MSRGKIVFPQSAFLCTSCTRLIANADFLRLTCTMKQLACGVICGSPQLQLSWRQDYPAADSSERVESCCHNWLLASLQGSDGKALGCWSDRERVQECSKPNSAPSWLGNMAKLLHTPRYASPISKIRSRPSSAGSSQDWDKSEGDFQEGPR